MLRWCSQQILRLACISNPWLATGDACDLFLRPSCWWAASLLLLTMKAQQCLQAQDIILLQTIIHTDLVIHLNADNQVPADKPQVQVTYLEADQSSPAKLHNESTGCTGEISLSYLKLKLSLSLSNVKQKTSVQYHLILSLTTIATQQGREWFSPSGLGFPLWLWN